MSLTNMESTNGYLKATADNAIAISQPIEQENGTDIILGTSDQDTIYTSSEMVAGVPIIITFDDDSTLEYTPPSVIHTTGGPNLDPFGDGSFIAGAAFDGDLTSYGTEINLETRVAGLEIFGGTTPRGLSALHVTRAVEAVISTLILPAVKTVLIRAYPTELSPNTSYTVLHDGTSYGSYQRVELYAYGTQSWVTRVGSSSSGQIGAALAYNPHNPTLNTWQSLGVSGSGTSIKLYKNGLLGASATASETITASQYGMTFGATVHGLSEYEGYMCDFLAFDRELTLAEHSRYHTDDTMMYVNESWSVDISAVSGGKTPVSVYQEADGYEKDFFSLKNVGVDFGYTNISDSSSTNTNPDVVPIMTSNILPLGVASASNIHSTTYDAWKAFDSNTTAGGSFWATANGVDAAWIQYQFDTPTAVNSFYIKPYGNEATESPNSFIIYGSDTGVFSGEEVILDTQTGLLGTFWTYDTFIEFPFSNVHAYSYYRLDISSNNGAIQIYIAAIKMGYQEIDTLVTDTLIVDGDLLVITKDDDSTHELIASGVTGSGPYTLDTTSVTAGEVPTRVFLKNSEVSFDAGNGYNVPVKESSINTPHLAPPVTPPDLTLNLAAHYLLNNNADDCFGTYDGTSNENLFTGDVSTFDGVDDYIHISDYDSGRLDTTVTVSTWYQPDTIGNSDVIYSYMFTASGGGSTANSGFFIVLDGNGHFYIAYNVLNNEAWANDDGESATSYSVVNKANSHTAVAGQLYHIVGTINDNVSKLYIDGILACTVTTTQSMRYATTLLTRPTITIGSLYYADIDTAYYGAEGSISNVRHYLDVKDQTFIDDLYAEGYYPKPLTEPTTTGLIARYPLTGTAEDSTGNYDGTEISMSYVDDSEFGSVARFNDIDSYIGVNIPLVKSISLWVKLDAPQTTEYHTLFDDDGVGDNFSIISWGLGNNLSFYYGASNFAQAISINDLTTNTHIAFCTNGDVYIDNIKLNSGTAVSSATISHIGALNNLNPVYYTDGNIFNFRAYDQVLTQQEVTDIYNYEKNFRSIDIDDGLVAYYPLADNSLDNYYNEYDGTDTAMTYDGDSGVFNGTSSFIALPTSTEMKIQEFTISFWVKPETSYTGARSMFGFNDSQAKYGFHIAETTGGAVYSGIIASDGATTTSSLTTELLNTSNYRLVTVVVDSNLSIYIDGVLDIANIVSSPLVYTTTMYPRIGSRSIRSELLYYYDGNIQDFRFYNKALTPEQIEVIHNEKAPPEELYILKEQTTFLPLRISGRSLETKVSLPNSGNTCSEINFDVNKEP